MGYIGLEKELLTTESSLMVLQYLPRCTGESAQFGWVFIPEVGCVGKSASRYLKGFHFGP